VLKIKYILLLLILPLFCSAQNSTEIIIIQLQKGINATLFESRLNTQQSDLQINTKEKLCDALNIYSFYVSTTKDQQNIIPFLQTQREVVAAQRIQKIEYRSAPLNDPYFNLQWNLINEGIIGGVADADTDADLAWEYGKGDLTKNNDSIVIAIIDAGFDILHEDLNFFTNRHEIANDLIDNDNNGYVDDLHGWNIENGNGNTNTGTLSVWHATSVSGSAAAIGNNSIGIAGMAYKGKILPVHLGPVSSDSVIKAYDYVIKMRQLYNNSNGDSGAYVVAINSSFGISDSPNNNTVWCNLYDFMGSIGIVNTTATDNKSLNYDVVDDMPGNCSSIFIINTTYSDKNDNLGNCGYGVNNVDIAAPGSALQLTRPGNLYAAGTGTSFAAPQVAGAVAVLYSSACDSFLVVAKNNPDTAAFLIRKFILNSAEKKTAFTNKVSSNGRLNVFNAVNEMRKFCGENIIIAPLSNEFKIYWSSEKDGVLYFNYDLLEAGSTGIFIYDVLGKEIAQYHSNNINKGNYTEALPLENLSHGEYFIRLRLNDKWSDVNKFVVY